MISQHQHYYVPDSSHWPIVGSIGLFFMVLGGVAWLHGHGVGPYVFLGGVMVMAYMMFGWFRDVIDESMAGRYSAQVDRSFRWGMSWFIFSEVMFFCAFFGALYYARELSIPWLSGKGAHSELTHYLLWPDFKAHWPLLMNPDPSKFVGPNEVMSPWGLPAINTALLLTSGVTITWAHWALKMHRRMSLLIGLGLTVLLGVLFLGCQAFEYHHAYEELGLTLHSGIYGTTFFMLTGFHGAHVTIGTIMLFVTWLRCKRGHFTPEKHFAFEAVAWYWHFVDVVWLFLFIFVYWL